jgi:vacuolar-type H+-ATPase subunit F/Vma7
MSRLLVITHPTLAPGFHLAGVDAYGAEDVETAQELIASWLDAGETGLLAIDEGLLAGMDPVFIRRLEAAAHLPYLAIPGSAAPGAHALRRRNLVEMIRRTTGFHITFKGGASED